MSQVDGVLFVTPEYNRSVPASLKNAIDVDSRMRLPLQELVDQVGAGTIPIPAGPVFPMEAIVDAHRTMETVKGRSNDFISTETPRRRCARSWTASALSI